jgi:hypothetical protein
MPADVDIIVTSSDTNPETAEVRLIVETKLVLQDIRSAEDTLKNAMLRMSSPVGLLVTPGRMWVYSDQYTSQALESVIQIGDFDISHLLQFKPKSTSQDEARRFESVVQQFLENLPQLASEVRSTNDHLWNVLNTYVLPAIENGRIRAAAPRYRN